MSLIINVNKPIANFWISRNDVLISSKSNAIGSASETIEIVSNNIDRIDIDINIGKRVQRVEIERIHLEEDTATKRT